MPTGLISRFPFPNKLWPARFASLPIVVSLLVTAVAFAGAEEEMHLFQNGVDTYDGAASVMIIAGPKNADLNFGSGGALLVGAGRSVERRALLKFDIESLAGAKVTRDAELELVQVNTSGFSSGTFEIGIYAIAAENASWIAGEGNGDVAQAGEPNWNFRAYDARESETKGWAGGPGMQKAGIDYDPQPVATWDYDAGRNNSVITIAIPRETVQHWIDTPAENGGLLFLKISSPEEALDAMGGFHSTNSRTLTHRPKLKVFYER